MSRRRTSAPATTDAHRPGERRLGRLAAAAALTAVVVVACVAVPARALTGQGDEAGVPAPLRLVEQSGWVAPTGVFRVKLEVPAVAAGSQVQARLYREISDRDALEATAAGDELGSPVLPTVSVPLVAGPAGRTIELDYQLATSGSPTYGFAIRNPGVYPLAISVVDPSGDETARIVTHLVRLPDESYDRSPLDVALVVPVDAPLAHQPDGSIDLPDDQLAALQNLIALLRQHAGVPLSVAPTPETVAALADADRSAGSSSTEALQKAVVGRQVLAGPYVPVDSGAWVEQGLTDRYQAQRAAGADTLQRLLGVTPDQRTELVDGSTTPDVLSEWATSGVSQAVVPDDRLRPTSSRRQPSTLTQTFDLTSSNDERVTSLPADVDMTARLTAGDDRVLAAHEVLADLALVALERSSGQGCVAAVSATRGCVRGLAVQLPASAADAAVALGALLPALADRDGAATLPPSAATSSGTAEAAALVTPLTIDAAIEVTDPASATGTSSARSPRLTRQLQPIAPPSLGSYPARLGRTDLRVDGFRSMVVPGDARGEDLVASLDQVVLASGSIGLDEAGRSSYLDGADETVSTQLGLVTAPDQGVVTLTSREGRIPLSISNALDYPVRVRIRLESAKLDFPDGNEQFVELPPNTPTRIDVRVEARASGAFPLEVQVSSVDGNLAVTTTKFNVRSTAVSGVGLVLTIVAGLFLLLWWGRHFRNTRRDRRLIGSGHPVLRAVGDPTPPTDGPAGGGAAARRRAPWAGRPARAIRYAPVDET